MNTIFNYIKIIAWIIIGLIYSFPFNNNSIILWIAIFVIIIDEITIILYSKEEKE